MIRIRVLGRVSVERVDGAVGSAGEQRKPLALLVLLAMAGRRGLTRDELLGYLWPNTDAESGRKSLKQTVYSLRRDLGGDRVIVSSDGDQRLAVSCETVSMDAWDFEQAAANDELQQAAALYDGDFLAGFSIRASAEFDYWADRERLRLANLYASVLERLAVKAQSNEDFATARDSWWRLAALKPLDSRIAVRLIESLAATGDRSAALMHARVHQTLLREELDAAPDAAVAALEESLRNGATNGSRSALSTTDHAITRPSPPPGVIPAAAHDETLGDSPGLAALFDVRHRVRSTRMRRVVASGAIVIGAALALFSVLRGKEMPRLQGATQQNLVLVAPFRVESSDSALGYLSDGMAELLAATFTGEGGLRAVDPPAAAAALRKPAGNEGSTHEASRAEALGAARSLGAGRVLLGAVVGMSSRIVIQAQLLTVPDGRVTAEASVAGPADSLIALTERMTAQLLSGNADRAERRLGSELSSSLAAVRAYIEGRAAYRNGRYAEATRHFQRAVAIDSTFAAAGVGLAMTAGFVSELDARGLGLQIAWTHRERLGSRDRAYLEAALGPKYPAPSTWIESIQADERALQAYPILPELWYEMGDGFYHQGRAHDVTDADARATAAFERARALDSAYVAPLGHLVELAATHGDTARVRRLAARYFALDSVGDVANYLRWRVAVALGDSSSLSLVRRDLAAKSEAVLQRVRGSALLDGVGLEDADRAAALLRARAMGSVEGWRLRVDLFGYALNRGRPTAALQELTVGEGSGALARTQSLAHRIAGTLFWDGDRDAAVTAARELAQTFARTSAAGASGTDALGLCVVGLWELDQGNTDGSRAVLARLRAIERNARPEPITEPVRAAATARECLVLLDAAAAVDSRRSDARRAVERLDSLALYGTTLGLTAALSEAANLLVSKLYERLGDNTRALVAARRTPHFWGGTWYLSSYLLMEARLASRAGERGEAVRAYRHFLALRSAPEPALRAQVDSARAELARLERE